MTLVVGVAAPDGLILAADSRSLLSCPESPPRVVTDYAQKVFQIDGYGVATYGVATIGGRTIAGQVEEFVARSDGPPADVDALTTALGRFFQDRLLESRRDWTEDAGSMLGFLVAGYDTAGVGCIREIRVPAPDRPQIFDSGLGTRRPGFVWHGSTEVLSRLFRGYDRKRLMAADVALEPDTLAALEDLEYEPIMPRTVQDAVDLSHLLIRTTIDVQRFTCGTRGDYASIPTCGGPINVLAIRRDGAEWVDRQPLTTAAPGPPHDAEPPARDLSP